PPLARISPREYIPATATSSPSPTRRPTPHGAMPIGRNTTENASAMHFLAAAAKKTNSADGAKLAETLTGLTIESAFGADGHVTLRADDHTIVGYAIGWGTTIPSEPY